MNDRSEAVDHEPFDVHRSGSDANRDDTAILLDALDICRS